MVWKGSSRVRKYLQKSIGILESFFFFLTKLLDEKYSKPHFIQKAYIDFCCQTPLSPQNSHIHPQMVFCSFFSKNTAFFKKLVK